MGKRKMFLRMVLSSIMRRRSRVVIAMLAVAIGATTLASLAMITIDVPRQMAREMRSYGANVVVLPQGEQGSYDPQILAEITNELPADLLLGAVGLEYEPITINDLPYVAVGTDLQQAKAINPYWYIDGEWPSDTGEVLIGREIAQAIDVTVGDKITLTQLVTAAPKDDETSEASEEPDQADSQPTGMPTDGENPIAPEGMENEPKQPVEGNEIRQLPAKISGVLETGGSEDGFVYLASVDLSELTGRDYMLTVAELSIAADEETLDSLANQITEKHPEVNAAPVARLTHSDANVLEMLRSLMLIITVIVLALIMIGVSTTMMAVVTERRTEIGLRKALGAGNRSIIGEFLGEAVVLGLIGGVLGAVMGYGLAQVISFNVFHRTVAFQPLVVLATIVVSVLIATLASLIPVRRAIDVDPALVLRGE